VHRRRSQHVTTAPYDVGMGQVIDIATWKRSHSVRAAKWHPSLGAKDRPAGSQGRDGRPDQMLIAEPDEADHREIESLDRAVRRLHPIVLDRVGRTRQIEERVETELLAIMGEVTVGLFGEAARRAERLADRLAAGSNPSG
jgi:hypothetical protein